MALAAWAGGEHNPWLTRIREVFQRQGLGEPPPPGTPEPLAFAAPGRIEELLDAAGFDDPELATLDFAFRAPSLDEWWEHSVRTSGTTMRLVAALSPAEHYALRDAFDDAYAEYVTDDGVTVPARALVAAASA